MDRSESMSVIVAIVVADEIQTFNAENVVVADPSESMYIIVAVVVVDRSESMSVIVAVVVAVDIVDAVLVTEDVKGLDVK